MCLDLVGEILVARRQLVIVPGLGDRGQLYQLFRPLWTLFGYDVHIVVFGWKHADVPFAEARKQLLARIDMLSGDVCVIGVSAGGSAAIHALLARPDVVTHAVTVCSPYTLPRDWKLNRLLVQSVRDLDLRFVQIDNMLKQRVLSVFGAYDPKVPAILSRPRGVRSVGLPTIGHGLSIGAALTIFCWPIWRFLRLPS
jgi:pimeloyl-ACP methyl ester carboxylesterase